jgi:Ca-activated chloride channel family protein
MFTARLETSRIKAGEPKTMGLLIEAKAPALPEQQLSRTPQAIVFVVDRSGSMGGGRLDLVKNTIGEMVGQLNPADYLAVVSFDDRVETHLELRQKGELNAQEIRRDLAQLEPRGGTNLELGYRHGLAEAAKAPEGVEAKLILLSDGHANRGNRSPQELGQLAALATEHLVTSSTIGIGASFDETILSSIAGSGQGNHFAAVQLEEAIAGLQDEIDGLLQRSVRNIRCNISVTDPEYLKRVTPVGYVRSKTSSSEGLEVALGELVSGEERGYAFVLEFSKFDRNFAGTVGVRVEITAENALTGDEVRYHEMIEFEVASPTNFIAPELDEDVVAEIAVFRMAGVKERAARAAQSGSFAEARQMLSDAQGDTSLLLRELDKMSPRVRMRVLAENRELADLLGFTDLELSKRVTESSYRSARSKPNPRDSK